MKFMLIFVLFITLFVSFSNGLYPVILVPGDGGSQLDARYIKTPPHYYCGFKNRWFSLWLNVFLMTPLTLDCFVKTIELQYNSTDRTTRDQDFCEVRAPSFGKVDRIEYLTDYDVSAASYFYNIIHHLEIKYGYKSNVDILGAPFDFRKAPNEQEVLMKNLTKLILEAYHKGGQKPVVLIGHSLGNLVITKVLNRFNTAFKEKYIKTFVSISGPYGGALDALKTVLSGNNEHIPILRPLRLREAQNSWPSTYYLIPNNDIWANKTIVMTSSSNYTISTVDRLLNSSGIQYAYEHYKDISKIPSLRPPQVSVYCVYSNNVATSKLLDYRGLNFPDDQPKITYGVGDGTVNLVSLQVCDSWGSQQKQSVKTFTIPDATHLNIIRTQNILDVLDKIIMEF